MRLNRNVVTNGQWATAQAQAQADAFADMYAFDSEGDTIADIASEWVAQAETYYAQLEYNQAEHDNQAGLNNFTW